MAAISNTLFTFLTAGKRVVSVKDTYGGTSKIFIDFLPHYDVDVKLCETTNHDQLEEEIAKGCDLVYLETPTNPTLKVVDVQRLSQAAKKVNAIVVVDNTFATPINQNPLQLGADLVIHSATKFLCGHSDAMCFNNIISQRQTQSGLYLMSYSSFRFLIKSVARRSKVSAIFGVCRKTILERTSSTYWFSIDLS